MLPPQPRVSAQPCSQALPPEAEQPGSTGTKSHPPYFGQGGDAATVTPARGWSPVSPTFPTPRGTQGHTHTLDPCNQPGCCPRSGSNEASWPAPTPPWQQRGRREGRRQRQLRDVMADTEAEGTRMLSTHPVLTEERCLPAVPLLQHSICWLSGGETLNASQEPRPARLLQKLTASAGLLLPQGNRNQLIPHICWGTDTAGTWLAVPYLKALTAAQGKHTMTKHAVKLPLIHPPSFSTATSLCVLS